MAKGKIEHNLIKASGGFCNKSHFHVPKGNLDLQFAPSPDGVILQKKTKASQHTSEKQRTQRDLWQTFDCIWSNMPFAPKKALIGFYLEWERVHKLGRTPYQWFMSRAMKNTMAEELVEVFGVSLSRMRRKFSEKDVKFISQISSKTFTTQNYTESFYERPIRRV